MRPFDGMRVRRGDEELPAEVKAELEAVDAALRGEETPGMEDLATLTRDLRAECPSRDPDFDAALDAWAAAGFPRDGRPGLGSDRKGAARDGSPFGRLTSLSPRRWLPPAAAAATLIVVVGVSITQIDGESGTSGGDAETLQAPSDPSGQPGAAERGPAPGADNESFEAAPQGDAGALPPEERVPRRAASLALIAPGDEVAGIAGQAIEAAEGADGVVQSSRVTGEGERARATLTLRVPAPSLDRVLADLTDLADVSAQTGAPRIRSGARFATIALEVSAAGSEQDEGASFGDALDDAGGVLEAAAAVLLISAAVLFPVALIAAIAYFTAAAVRAKARERVLDDE